MVDIEQSGVELDSALLSAVEQGIEHALKAHGVAANVSVVIAQREEIQAVNREARGVDAPTDVLSFPAWEGDEARRPPDGFLGDMMICAPVAFAQANEYGHSPAREFSFLAVHAALHLLGYDHMEPLEEARMLRMQKIILSEMGMER